MRPVLIAVILFILSLIYRINGIFANHPFWVDEFSSAKSARQILEYGTSYLIAPSTYSETHNFTTYHLIAVFFRFFGQFEWVARFPFVIIGSLIPVAVFFLAQKMFNKTVGVTAALLTAFSYIMILWSRQARGYVLLQLLILIATYLYFKLISSASGRNARRRIYFWLALVSVLGILTHLTYYVFLAALALHLILINRRRFAVLIKKPRYLLGLALGISLIFIILWLQGVIDFFGTSFFGGNNVWYYHSLLWREYGLITFLGLGGLLIGAKKYPHYCLPILIYITMQLLFVSFIWGHHMSKYVISIFPFLFVGTAYTVNTLVSAVIRENSHKAIITFLVVTFIIANGYKFVTAPKDYYSLNHDFREISNIDYHEVYKIILTATNKHSDDTVIIETWPDRALWYLGNDYPHVALFRWQNEGGIISGHAKNSDYIIGDDGLKRFSRKGGLLFVGEEKDLTKLMKAYKYGFIFIDDTSYPADVIDYARKNLKEEIYLDHYPLDNNPYSIWPATLYSWGIE